MQFEHDIDQARPEPAGVPGAGEWPRIPWGDPETPEPEPIRLICEADDCRQTAVVFCRRLLCAEHALPELGDDSPGWVELVKPGWMRPASVDRGLSAAPLV